MCNCWIRIRLGLTQASFAAIIVNNILPPLICANSAPKENIQIAFGRQQWPKG